MGVVGHEGPVQLNKESPPRTQKGLQAGSPLQFWKGETDMPCHPSHTKGPGADEYQADIGEREFFVKQQAEPTVREQLLKALKGLDRTMREQLSSLVDTGKVNASKTRTAFNQARAAIERAKLEPEGCCHELEGCGETAREAGRP